MKIILLIVLCQLPTMLIAQRVESVRLSPCDIDSDPDYLYRNRLISKEMNHDTCVLHIGIVRNCEFSPTIEAHFAADSLILLITNKSELWAACECCFEMNITLTGITNSIFNVYRQLSNGNAAEFKTYSNKYIFPTPEEIEHIAYNNAYFNDSVKVGGWITYHENSKKINYKSYFEIDSTGKSQLKWYIRYSKSGEIEEICASLGMDSEGYQNLSCASYSSYKRMFGIGLSDDD